MGFNLRGDKNSLAVLSSKRVKAYSRTRADEAFALPSFSDAMPAPATERPPPTPSTVPKPEHRTEQRQQHPERDSEKVKQTMLLHESVFKEQLHELHRLYQRQCMLMVESQTGNSCHPRSEPPSSNSSLSCNPETFKPLDDGILRDARVNRAFDNHDNVSMRPTQMADAKPRLAGAYQNPEQACARPLLDLERPAGCHPIFYLDRSPNGVATFDLERPPDDYLEVGMGNEKARAMGLSHRSAHASVLSHSNSAKENGDILITKENGDSVSWNTRDLWGRTMPDYHSSYGRGAAINVCKDEFDSKERVCEGYFLPGGFGNGISDPRKDCWTSSHPSNMTSPIPRQVSISYPVGGVSASGCLPDLNGELGLAENQTSLMQRKIGKLVNDRHNIDIEADQSAHYGSSKLPHWLLQPPPMSSMVTAATKFPPQQEKTTLSSSQVHDISKSLGAYNSNPETLFSSQVHDISKSLGAYSSNPGTLMNSSTFQEPYDPWSHGKANSQEEVSYKQPSSSLPFFSAGNVGATQGSADGAHFNRVSDESITSFLSFPTDAGKMGRSAASRMLSSHSTGRQDMVFDAQATSKGLLSSIGSREMMSLPPVMPPVMLPWYQAQQRESFSSLVRHASNPEPPFQIENHAMPVNQWGAAAIHQALPRSAVDNGEDVAYGMHSVGSNFEGRCLVAAKPESPRKEGGFDFLSYNAERNAANAWNPVERPFYIGQITEEPFLSSDDRSRILSRNVFDLNVSSDVSPVEQNFESWHFTRSSCDVNQNQAFKEGGDIVRSSELDMSRVNKALCVNEPLQGTGFPDRAAEKGMGLEVLSKDASQSLFDSNFCSKPGTVSFSREGLGGHDMCTDNCSGDNEAGAGYVEVKSSDASGLTSCESRDAAHLELAKARDDSNTSSGAACQSRESRIPACHKEEAAFSMNMESRSGALPLATANEGQQWGSFLFSGTQSAPRLADTKGDYLGLICTDESEAANSSFARKHSPEATEIAELLLSLSFELPRVAEGQEAINHQEKSLDWLANIIPEEEDREEEQGLDVDMAGSTMLEGKVSVMDVGEQAMDHFELAVLALQPINPNVEHLTAQVVERGSLAENGPSLPTLRRRSSRRGRAVKDFQREILGCMTSLSRHEITGDLQFIEGLIKSTTEDMNICTFSEEDDNKPLSSPESGSQKRARGPTKAFRGRKPNGTLVDVCSWGEITRRKRSQRSCLPPVVQSSPLEINGGDGALALLM